MPVVKLPFTCFADIMPRRKRKPRRHLVRIYTDVLVPEYSASDLEPAIRIQQGVRSHGFRYPDPTTTYLAHRGELLLAARDSEGEPLGVERFEASVGKEVQEKRYPFETPAEGYAMLPRPGKRHDGTVPHPLDVPTLRSICELKEYEDPKIELVEYEDHIALAQHFYERSAALVDGALFLQAQEPAWLIFQRKANEEPRVLRDHYPDPSRSDEYFRLDDLERGLGSVQLTVAERSAILANPGVEILTADGITRVDSFEIAKRCFELGKSLAQNSENQHRDDDVGPMPILAAQDLDGFHMDQTLKVFDEMERGWRLLFASNGGRRPEREYAEPIERLLRRIAYERASGGYIPSEELTEADLEALIDLPTV